MLVDAFYGSQGGPQGKQIEAGDRVSLTSPRTGVATTFIIAGVLNDGTAFYGISGGEFQYPVLMSRPAALHTFDADARPASALLRTAPVPTPPP